MEKEIFLIGVRKIYSLKKQQNYYMVDYVKDDIPKTDYISAEEYNNLAKKQKPYTKMIGIFGLNSYDKVYLTDLK